ncbi:MAG: 1-deoxy-D-xylulose-5-phosphate reductoisomerase [Methylobacteriaceae bacterium]|nr:1-deoxy-D-xylulose-5-phosphate reductoisomerase [Methylobacteriaceae bacterium]
MSPQAPADASPRPAPREESAPRVVSILGATGSVGRSTIDVLRAHKGRFAVSAVAGGSDAAGLARAALETGARLAAIADPSAYRALREALAGTGVEAAAGPEAVIEAALRPADLVVAAIVGAAGVAPTHAALAAGRSVALANKESLVCAGAAVMRAAAASGARVLPMDSEHNALFQALGEADPARVEKLVITASGGPFRTWSAERIATATRAEALAHPNWAMGPKITIDSATMMNKGLELIEAHHLFGLGADRLDVLVHPQSVVHGLVMFTDGMSVAGLAHPDMRVPIAHCLGWPHRLATPARRLDLAELGALTFERPDIGRFPALGLAVEALREGGAAATVLNAANEVAVAAFLDGRIAFSDIARLVALAREAMARERLAEPATVAEALAINDAARQTSDAILAGSFRSGILS